MVRAWLTSLLVASGVGLSHVAFAAEEALEAVVAALPGELYQVSSAGRWRRGEVEGFYRVVVVRGGYERVSDRLYIQWIRDGDSEDPPRVVATVGLREINDEGRFTVSYSVTPLATNQLTVTVTAHDGVTRQRRQFVFVAAAPGTYRTKAADTPASRENRPARGAAPIDQGR